MRYYDTLRQIAVFAVGGGVIYLIVTIPQLQPTHPTTWCHASCELGAGLMHPEDELKALIQLILVVATIVVSSSALGND